MAKKKVKSMQSIERDLERVALGMLEHLIKPKPRHKITLAYGAIQLMAKKKVKPMRSIERDLERAALGMLAYGVIQLLEYLRKPKPRHKITITIEKPPQRLLQPGYIDFEEIND